MPTDSSLADRLDPSRFADDEPVELAIADHDTAAEDIPPDRWVLVSNRLFGRLILLGRAYGLHFASLVDSIGDTSLDAGQCESVLEELQFLSEVVSDPALSEVFAKLIPRVDRVARNWNERLYVRPP